MTKDEQVRPFLKWAGGKRQLAQAIHDRIPAVYGTYYEPFVGAGAMLFNEQPEKAVVNDLNAQLALTYRVVRDDVEGLIERLEAHKAENSEEHFYEVRGLDRSPDFDRIPDVDKAARMIYLNKTCFNGLYRVNSQGRFNVPYGRYASPAILGERERQAPGGLRIPERRGRRDTLRRLRGLRLLRGGGRFRLLRPALRQPRRREFHKLSGRRIRP